jgi:hypothetical protein
MVNQHWDLIRIEGRLEGRLPRTFKERTAQEWNRVTSQLHEHALEGLVYSRWKDRLPYHAARLLEIEWKLQAQRNLAYFSELRWLGMRCLQLGIHPALLKGAALIGDIYDDIGARSMADIDLLTDSEGMKWIAEELRARGYDDVSATKWEANSFKRVLSRKSQGIELVFELHERLFFNEGDVDWRFVESSELGSPGFRKLAAEDMLVHLMGHLGYQHTFLHLTWLVDIDLFIRKHEIDWARVMVLATRLKQRRSALATLWACHDYLGTPVPSRLLKMGWSKLLSGEFLWFPKKRPLRYYLIKHLMKDSAREALVYDLLWLRRRAWR